MKLILKIIVAGIALLSLVPFGFILYVFTLSGDMCGNEIFAEYPSPNGKMKAVVFQRDCGATTGFSTQVSVLGVESELKNSSGNVLILDGHPDSVAPDLKWKSNEEITINRTLSGEEHKANNSVGLLKKIKVVYSVENS